jgi:hypothetical protein
LRRVEGRFVLIHAEELLGSYTTEQEAIHAGFERCGAVPFLVREVRNPASERRRRADSGSAP